MRFANRKAYVTGGTGFIGRVVVRRLLSEGADVTVLARDPDRAADLAAIGANVEKGNVVEPATLHPEGHDLLIHAAAWVGFGVPRGKRGLFQDTNVEGTRNVLDAARRADVAKVVHVSSVAAAARGDGVTPVTEETRRSGRPLSLYEITKTEAHRVARESGLDLALPMPGLVLGPGSEFDPFFRALAKGRLPVTLKRDPVKGWVHVDDTAEAILLSALKGKGDYLVVDENATARELFAHLARDWKVPVPRFGIRPGPIQIAARLAESAYHAFGKTPPLSVEVARSLAAPMKYDASKARRELGWVPDLWARLRADFKHYAA